jgi:hypothetical protein
MRTTDQYLDLITPFFRGQPNFTATVTLLVDLVSKLEEFVAYNIPQCFDVDTAIGVQLDATGQWIGRDRRVRTPISAYFTWDHPELNLGWDHGVWQGPYSPPNHIDSLDDETYRRLLYAKIAANNSDGTMASIDNVYNVFLNGPGAPESPATHVYIEDRQDMSMVVGVSGEIPNVLVQELLTTEFVPIKPEGVRLYHQVTSVNNAPLFGFDVDNEYIAGWDQGAWGVPPAGISEPI